jgi:hypothetical protein
MSKPPRRISRDIEKQFTTSHKQMFKRWAEYHHHKSVIEDELTRRLFGTDELSGDAKKSLEILRAGYVPRVSPLLNQNGVGPLTFPVRPGVNILSPPYDFTLRVALGSNMPGIMTSLNSGNFGVSVSAGSGSNSYAAAGVCLFVIPSDPTRTLSIRPCFQYDYSWSCKSVGTPSSYSAGSISAEISGHGPTGTWNYPGRSKQLWTGGSNLWSDNKGRQADIYRVEDCTLTVSGSEYYVLSYVCQGSTNSGKNLFGWSAAYVVLHCRVPFIVIEQF